MELLKSHWVLFCKHEKQCVWFKKQKERHCSSKLVTMMFKTHKIWFPPEFALHLGKEPALHSSLASYSRRSNKMILNLLSMLVCLHLFCILSRLHNLWDFPSRLALCTINLPHFFLHRCAHLYEFQVVLSAQGHMFLVCIFSVGSRDKIGSLIPDKIDVSSLSCR